MWNMSIRSKYILIIVLLGLPIPVLAADTEAENLDSDTAGSIKRDSLSLDEIAKELSNPVTSLATINNDFEYRIYQGSLPGADDDTAYIYTLRPSIPIPLSNGKNILMRFGIPINGEQPIYAIGNEQVSPFLIRQNASTIPTDGTFDNYHGHSHLGDIDFDIAYGGVSDSGFISMYGIAGVLPSSQDLSQSIDQYQLGPEIAFGKVTGWGVYGAWLTHLTRVSGEDKWDTNMTSLKIFFAYGLGNGWQVFSNPVIEYDWEGDSDNQLFLPLGAGVSKTTRFGSMPMKLAFEIQKYITSPDAIGPDWLFTFSFTPVIRNPFQD
jgi:hypothetical protein